MKPMTVELPQSPGGWEMQIHLLNDRIATLEAQLAEKDRENRLIHDTMQAAIFDKVRLTAQLAEERGRIAGDQARLFHTEGACSDLMKENARLTAQVEKARAAIRGLIRATFASDTETWPKAIAEADALLTELTSSDEPKPREFDKYGMFKEPADG